MTLALLLLQVAAGAQLLQLFEAMGMFIRSDSFEVALPLPPHPHATFPLHPASHPPDRATAPAVAYTSPSFLFPRSPQAHALPHLKRIARELKQRHPEVPLMVFPRGAAYSLPALQDAGFDVLTLDGSRERRSVREALPGVCLQGDFDPSLLIDSTEEAVRAAVNEMLDELGAEQLIANLREGGWSSCFSTPSKLPVSPL